LSKKETSIDVDLSRNGKSLYIFFGGIAAGIAMPPFEFYSYAKIIDENKIFVRDSKQCWYQNGLGNLSSDIGTTVKLLKEHIDKINPERIYFVGNSMGGYAAILFGALIGRGEVIAFSPQTFISPFLRYKHKDWRWFRQIMLTYCRSFLKDRVWDLRLLLLKMKPRLKISIFVSSSDKLDVIHALHLRAIGNINIFEFEKGGHNVVKLLRDEGKLSLIMSGDYSHM
jgi:hypothetical protein